MFDHQLADAAIGFQRITRRTNGFQESATLLVIGKVDHRSTKRKRGRRFATPV
jgi:hypothetical protein